MTFRKIKSKKQTSKDPHQIKTIVRRLSPAKKKKESTSFYLVPKITSLAFFRCQRFLSGHTTLEREASQSVSNSFAKHNLIRSRRWSSTLIEPRANLLRKEGGMVF